MKPYNSPLNQLLEQMSTQELDALLLAELRADPIDDGAVRRILAILEQREKDFPVEISPRIEKAVEEYNYSRTTRKLRPGSRYRRLVQAASIAVVLGMLLFLVPARANAESFWQMLTRWSDSFFEFFSPDSEVPPQPEYEFHTDHEGLQQVYDEVVKMGITKPVVPMWLWEEYELMELKSRNTPTSFGLYSCFKYDTSNFIFRIDLLSTKFSHLYFKDISSVFYKEINGTEYKIGNNNNHWIVVWTVDSIECSIFVDCQENELYEILNSIYSMEA